MSATPKPVVGLFDVDETLMHTGGSGARSWQFVFQKIHGIPATTCAHNSTGETDPRWHGPSSRVSSAVIPATGTWICIEGSCPDR
jgi:hypothetical protein